MGKNTSIILGDHFDQFIREELERGQYATASEVIRNGLRKLEEERTRNVLIQEALVIGENSGKPRLFNNEVFKEKMKKKYVQ